VIATDQDTTPDHRTSAPRQDASFMARSLFARVPPLEKTRSSLYTADRFKQSLTRFKRYRGPRLTTTFPVVSISMSDNDCRHEVKSTTPFSLLESR